MQDEKSRVARPKLRNLLSDEKNLTWKSVNRTPLWDKRKKSPCEATGSGGRQNPQRHVGC
jgi:hypothetical protein